MNQDAQPQLTPMTAEERSFLTDRAAREASSARTLAVVHAVFVAILLAIAFSGEAKRARGPLFVAGLVAVSGLGWSVYARLLSGWIREDLDAGLIAACRVRLLRKRRGQRKASYVHYLFLDPPLPRAKTVVGAAVYDAVSEGDCLAIRYFPRSKVLMRVERA